MLKVIDRTLQSFEILGSSIIVHLLSSFFQIRSICSRIFFSLLENIQVVVHALDFKLHHYEVLITDIGWIVQARVLRILTHGGDISFLLNHHWVSYLFEEIG